MKSGAQSIVLQHEAQIWGVVGGMGPLASAEFLCTVYEEAAGEAEQELPIVYMVSDPAMPDRTECLISGRERLLIDRFESDLNKLVMIGATRIVVCCVTIHPLICRLPDHLREKIVSLVDLIFDAVCRGPGKHLLFCTEGTRQMRIFQDHPSWGHAGASIVLPNEADQAAIHSMIYEVKKNKRSAKHLCLVKELMRRYEVTSFIAGCTEMHMIAKQQARASGCHPGGFCIDPLIDVAAIMSQCPARSQAIESPGIRLFL